MEIITIHKPNTQLSRLIEKACRGEEIIIARAVQNLSFAWLQSPTTGAGASRALGREDFLQ
jgi:hypothetical protein